MKSLAIASLVLVALLITLNRSQADPQKAEPTSKFVSISSVIEADGSLKLFALTETGDVYERSNVEVKRDDGTVGSRVVWKKTENIAESVDKKADGNTRLRAALDKPTRRQTIQ